MDARNKVVALFGAGIVLLLLALSALVAAPILFLAAACFAACSVGYAILHGAEIVRWYFANLGEQWRLAPEEAGALSRVLSWQEEAALAATEGIISEEQLMRMEGTCSPRDFDVVGELRMRRLRALLGLLPRI